MRSESAAAAKLAQDSATTGICVAQPGRRPVLLTAAKVIAFWRPLIREKAVVN